MYRTEQDIRQTIELLDEEGRSKVEIIEHLLESWHSTFNEDGTLEGEIKLLRQVLARILLHIISTEPQDRDVLAKILSQ